MTIYGTILPGAASIARSAALVNSLTERAKYKIKVLDWHRSHGNNNALTARHFGLGRMTLYRWIKKFKRSGVIGLNEESKRPKRLRQPTVSWNTVIRIVQLRKLYPAWSKYKLRALVMKEGIQVSASTVGRILKRRGLINKKISSKRRKAALRPKARFPHGLRISEPGDMIQMDTKHIMLPGGKKFYQFTAIDVLGKRKVMRVYPSESSRNGAKFIEECLLGFPFPIKAIQTDNGAPFQKEFDKFCQAKGIPHYFIYPRSPKQNSYVEISHEADQREFYQQGNVCSILGVMQRKIKEWEDIWNNVRPHQALDYLTPSEYLFKVQNSRISTKDIIILQT
ncbi:MAG: DDE-type integrase/transposase/recombinase [bacterium]|nr:DDE-type integrase/transposase/recombinase [bacterium]